MPLVDIPEVGEVEFPDSMSPDEIAGESDAIYRSRSKSTTTTTTRTAAEENAPLNPLQSLADTPLVKGVMQGVGDSVRSLFTPHGAIATGGIVAASMVNPMAGAALAAAMGAEQLGTSLGEMSVAVNQGDVQEAARHGVGVALGAAMVSAPLTVRAAMKAREVPKRVPITDESRLLTGIGRQSTEFTESTLDPSGISPETRLLPAPGETGGTILLDAGGIKAPEVPLKAGDRVTNLPPFEGEGIKPHLEDLYADSKAMAGVSGMGVRPQGEARSFADVGKNLDVAIEDRNKVANLEPNAPERVAAEEKVQSLFKELTEPPKISTETSLTSSLKASIEEHNKVVQLDYMDPARRVVEDKMEDLLHEVLRSGKSDSTLLQEVGKAIIPSLDRRIAYQDVRVIPNPPADYIPHEGLKGMPEPSGFLNGIPVYQSAYPKEAALLRKSLQSRFGTPNPVLRKEHRNALEKSSSPEEVLFVDDFNNGEPVAYFRRINIDVPSSTTAFKGLPEPQKESLTEVLKAFPSETESRIGITPKAPEIAIEAATAIGKLRRGISEALQDRNAKDMVVATYDAVNNQSAILAKQAGNSVRLEILGKSRPSGVRGALLDKFSPEEALDMEAMTPIVQAGGSLEKLRTDATKVINSEKSDAHSKQVFDHALKHFDELNPFREKVNDIFKAENAEEVSAGIETGAVENYVPQQYDFDLMLGADRPVVLDSTGGRGFGGSSYFRKQRVFPDYATAISEGYIPKTLDIGKLVEHRINGGQRMINSRIWVEGLREINSPIDGRPLVTDMITQTPKGTRVPPSGYRTWSPTTGITVAAHDTIMPLLEALTGKSAVPKALSNTAGFIKHATLLFDTFHVSRVLQKQAFLGLKGYEKGLSVLEYKNADLAKAVEAGEISPEIAEWAATKRPIIEEGVSNGLNLGRMSDAMYKDVVKDLPIVGPFNKWTFDKMSRGVMAQSYEWALERNKKLYPELDATQVSRRTAKEINQYFGNLGSQGVFKNKTFQDLMRLAFLAPQWVEAMATTEIKSAGQAVKAIGEKAISPTQPLRVGTLARGTGAGLGAYFVATQAMNWFLNGGFTWDTNEMKHALDLHIPDWIQDSPGYYLSPFSVPAELTHDVLRYTADGMGPLEVANKMRKNKSSAFTRATSDLMTGKDFFETPLVDTWERVKQAAVDLGPVPIAASSIKNSYLGSRQRALAGSLGFKIEPAKTEEQEESASRGREFRKVEDIVAAAARRINQDPSKTEEFMTWAEEHVEKVDEGRWKRAKADILRRTKRTR